MKILVATGYLRVCDCLVALCCGGRPPQGSWMIVVLELASWYGVVAIVCDMAL